MVHKGVWNPTTTVLPSELNIHWPEDPEILIDWKAMKTYIHNSKISGIVSATNI